MSAVIQPIARALELLRALNQQPQSTLTELHRMTGLPKSTVHRILQTLRSEGYVKSDVVRSMYSLTEKVRTLSEGYTEQDRLVEVGAEILLKATRQTGLPLAIGTLHGGRILVRYSSMPYSPIGSSHTTIGHVHSLLDSAMGNAYLAACSEAELERLIDFLARKSETCSVKGQVALQARKIVQAVRKRGYGFRESQRPGASATIAIALRQDKAVLGVLSLTTFAALLTGSTIQECLGVLNGAAQQILGGLSQE